jgi:hypothetical protein
MVGLAGKSRRLAKVEAALKAFSFTNKAFIFYNQASQPREGSLFYSTTQPMHQSGSRAAGTRVSIPARGESRAEPHAHKNVNK